MYVLFRICSWGGTVPRLVKCICGWRVFRLPSWCIWGVRCCGTLRGLGWQLLTDVSETVDTIF